MLELTKGQRSYQSKKARGYKTPARYNEEGQRWCSGYRSGGHWTDPVNFAGDSNLCRAHAQERMWAQYGITKLDGSLFRQEDYAALLVAQGGKCKLCGTLPGKSRLAVEHKHGEPGVYGLVCTQCNQGLERFDNHDGWFTKAQKMREDGPVL